MAEASFFPGAMFLLSKWYKRSEMGVRSAVLLSGGIISNAFGSLIASAILDLMDGVFELPAWRWLFFVEGSLTIFAAVAAMFILPDFPETTNPGWLTEKEIRLAVQRIQEDSHAGEDFVQQDASYAAAFWDVVTDRNVHLMTVFMTFQGIASSYALYFPTLASTLGYNAIISLSLCAPPWVLATVFTFLVSR